MTVYDRMYRKPLTKVLFYRGRKEELYMTYAVKKNIFGHKFNWTNTNNIKLNLKP